MPSEPETPPPILAELAEPTPARPESPPVRWREILAVLLLVVLADVTVYRGGGFAGYAVLFALAPVLLWLGAPLQRRGGAFWLLGPMFLLLAARLLWCGSWLAVGCGLALLVAFAMVLSGLRPYVLEAVVFASQTVQAGFEGLHRYWRTIQKKGVAIPRGMWLDYGLPVAALVVFSLLFLVANPDLFASLGETIQEALTQVRDWLLEVSPSGLEMLFWVAVLWVSVGLLRPVLMQALMEEKPPGAAPDASDTASIRASLYAAFRNTLLAVIVLFAVYLVFEFHTLWGREFPDGFYYSGYAHEGAAWLTVALALSTVILSLIFRGRVLEDSRQGRLRRLAWIWSAENMLLAVAVYHRLWIYVGFNGMTRMRMVGIFGMTCVVVGFALVIVKIVRRRDFVWLMRRHLWALALTVFAFALTPVDAIVHSYNVRRILAGDPAPSVQISVHPIDAEGVLVLLPLCDCDNAKIRDGILAMLAERLDEAEARSKRAARQGWTAWQLADELLLERLRASSDRWVEYQQDSLKRDKALATFREYAYQWY